MNSIIIEKLLLDDYYLYNELKKLAKEIKLEDEIDFESALHLAVEQFSISILQNKEIIMYRYYKYDEQINS